MTISFSGLASGLDTSSWVESLVALKQAKVETYEEERDNVASLQETLSSIKSFFSSFRSMLEKVTDAKFAIPSMDLFAQNLATSSDASILTAIATNEAEEATYDVLVDKLATETQVNSNHSFYTTIVETTTATADSKLTSLGVTAGNIGVTVNGIERGISITENDTIATFIEKLQNIGVEASYNEETGVFSMNISAGDINDIDNTNIVDALKLDGVNEGFVSNKLETSSTETVFTPATGDTLLAELGVSNGDITFHANDNDFIFSVHDDSSINDLVNFLNDNNIQAGLNDDGTFFINDALITDDSTTNFINAFGLSEDIFEHNQVSNELNYNTIVTQVSNATSDTLISDIGNGVNITDGMIAVVQNNDGQTFSITVNQSSTIGDFIQQLNNAGIDASIDNSGIIDINGAEFIGGDFNAEEIFNLAGTVSTINVAATGETELSHFGISNSMSTAERTVNIYNDNNVLMGSTLLTEFTTLDNLVDFINSFSGVTAVLEDGKLNITGGYIENATLTAFMNLDKSFTGISILGSAMSTTTTSPADGNSTLGEIITALGEESTVSGGYTFNFNGHDLSVNENTTLNELISLINSNGGTASLDGAGRLTVTGGPVSGAVADAFGMKTESVVSAEGNSELYVSQEVNADRDTTLAELGITSSSDLTYYIKNSVTGESKTVVAPSTSITLGEFLDGLSDFDITGSINNGIITLNNNGSYYITGGLADALGIGTITETRTTSSQSSSGSVTYYTSVFADSTTQLGELSSFSSGQFVIYDSADSILGTVTVSSTDTISNLFSKLNSYGITGSVSNGILSFTSAGGSYFNAGNSGATTLMSDLGISVMSSGTRTVTTGVTTTSTAAISYTGTFTADLSTTISDFATNATSPIYINNDSGRVATISLSSTDTINDLFDELSAYGITGSMSGGVMSFISDGAYYVTGNLMDELGISYSSTMVSGTIGKPTTSTAQITYTNTITATSNSTVLNILSSYSTRYLTIKSETGTTVGTITLSSSKTLDYMFDRLADYGITASLSGGVLSLDSADGNYITGDSTLLSALGITTTSSLVTTTTGLSTTSSSAVTYTNTVTATSSTTIFDLLSSSSSQYLNIKSENGTTIGTITLTSTETLDNMFDKLADYGITASLSGGVLSLDSADGNYIAGTSRLLSALGITRSDGVYVTITTGLSTTSGSQIKYTVTEYATEDTLLSDLVSSSYVTSGVTIKASNGTAVATILMPSTASVGTLIETMANYGVNASIKDGVITIDNSGGYYASGSLLTQLGIGTNTTYNTSTVGLTVTSTVVHTYTSVVTMRSSDTMNNLGYVSDSSSDYIYLVSRETGSNVASLRVSGTGTTINSLCNWLNSYMTASFSSTTGISIKSEDYYLTGDLADFLGISSEYSKTVATDVTSSGVVTYMGFKEMGTLRPGSTTPSGGLSKSGISTMSIGAGIVGNAENVGNIGDFGDLVETNGLNTLTYTTTLDDLGINSATIVIADTNSTNHFTMTVGGSTSIATWGSNLANYNLNISVKDGIFSIEYFDYGNGNKYYIESMSSNLVSALKLDGQAFSQVEAESGNTVTGTFNVEYSDGALIGNVFRDKDTILPFDSGTITVKSANGYVAGYITVRGAFTSMGELKSELAKYDITFDVQDGVVSFTPTGGYYIANMTGGLAGLFNIAFGPNNSYTIRVTSTTTNTDSKELSNKTVNTLTTSTTFSELGVISTQAIILANNGAAQLVTISPSSTVSDMISKLASYGITASVSNGKLTLEGSDTNYILNMGNELVNALKLSVGNGYTYSTSSEWHYSNETSSSPITYDKRYTLANETTFSDLGITSNQYITVRDNGTSRVVTVTSSSTVSDMISKLASYGITASVSNGKLTLEGDENSYITSISSSLKNALDLQAGNGYTYSTSSDYHYSNKTSSSPITYEASYNLTNSTSLSKLGISSNQYITINNNGTSQVVTVTSLSSISNMLAQLSNYGITGSVSNGYLTLQGSTDSYITGMSTSLKNALGLRVGSGYTYQSQNGYIYSIDSSDAVEYTKNVTVTGSTTAGNLGITSNQYITVRNNGTSRIVTVNASSTINNILSQLSSYGIDGSLTNGRLTLRGSDTSYITGISSTLADALGLKAGNGNSYTTSVYTGSYNSSSDPQYVEESNYITETTRLSDIYAGFSGATIAVKNTSGSTVGYVTLNSSDTVEDMLDKLAAQGIIGNVNSTGRILLSSGNGYSINNYDGASGLLSALKIGGATYVKVNGATTNTDSSQQKYNDNTAASVNDKLGDLLDNVSSGGISSYEFDITITKNDSSQVSNIFSANNTLQDVINWLETQGIEVETAQASSSGYLKLNITSFGDNTSITGGLADFLFSARGTDEYTTTTSFASTTTSTNLGAQSGTTMSDTTQLSDFGITGGNIKIVQDGITSVINLDLNNISTVKDFRDLLSGYGFNTSVTSDGRLSITASGNTYLESVSGGSNIIDILGLNNMEYVGLSQSSGELQDTAEQSSYVSGEPVEVIETSSQTAHADRDTLLSDLGITSGEFYVYNNGVKYTALISSDDTLGSLMNTLNSFGLQTSLTEGADGSVLRVLGSGDSYVAKSNSAANASNVVDVLFPNGIETSKTYTGTEQTSQEVTTYTPVTEDTLLSEFDQGLLAAQGDLSVTFNGVTSTIKIESDETFGSLLEKFRALGVEATLSDGQIMLQSGYNTFTINTDGTTSNLQATIGLVYQDDLGGYVASSDTVLSTVTTVEERTLSVANYADGATQLGSLNISDGTLTVYKDGQRAVIQVNSNETFDDLRSRLASAFSDLDLRFDDGYLTIFSKDGSVIDVGATTDTSNFSAITGISKNAETGEVVSARELYRVNGDSVLTQSGLFRTGTVTEGTFTIGDATFTIGAATTLSDIISQINTNDDANATAYWDNVDGKLVIQSRTTGAALVNIEAGTSNFTDIMGFTTSEWNADGSLNVTRMNISNQQLGSNARVTINGTTYTAMSNTITSDISRIKGLTINLHGLTEGSAITLTVERDKETLANAISDVVDSYNELMNNVDESIAIGGDLHSESTLKLIRNQLRSFMTSSDIGATVFRNLDSIGISVADASANNISTSTESIVYLTFDKDKFLEAYEADQTAVKELLVGGDNNHGIFTKVEELVESALQSVTGYFDIADTSFTREINRIDDKITKANAEIERYRERLEAKFNSMDLLIAQMQQQYSSFLTA